MECIIQMWLDMSSQIWIFLLHYLLHTPTEGLRRHAQRVSDFFQYVQRDVLPSKQA